MGSYIKKEDHDLKFAVLSSLTKDVRDPVENSLQSDEISILNSSLMMFSKVKYLIRRASSISNGRTLFQVFLIIPGVS